MSWSTPEPVFPPGGWSPLPSAMTSPMTSPIPVPVGSGEVFVVHTDRAAVNRWNGGIVGVHLGLAIGIIVLMFALMSLFGDGVPWFSMIPFGIVIAGQFLQVAVYAHVWGARSAITEPLVVGAGGFTLTTARGPIRLPWAAVATVQVQRRLFGRVLTIRLRPVALPARGSDAAPLSRRQWAWVGRNGLLLGERGLREGMDEIAAAISRIAGVPVR